MDAPTTPEEFVSRVVELGLATSRQVSLASKDLGVGDRTLKGAIEVMQRHGIVTTLQTDKIMKGDKSGFFYGEYKVLYLIGQGTFARVYRAQRGDEVFAVKVLRKRFRDEAKELEQFLREGRMGLKLRHPNIVSIVDVVPDIRNPFLVMEFVEGQTLRSLVKVRGKLPAPLALSLMIDISSGLAHAQSLGISHRDLKLSNVLISADGKCKLVDFGLAALADRKDPEQMADCPNARAIDYAALERGTGVRKDDPRSDVYFAGNMLYHMMAGQPALTETRDRLQRLGVNRFYEVKPLHEVVPEIPGVANGVVQRAMEVDPDKRLQTAAALREECKRALDHIERYGPGGRNDSGEDGSPSHQEDEIPTVEGEGFIVMLVESKTSLQDAIRDRLKARGYRVLVIQNPNRALARFAEGEDQPADCVVFGASELGNLALEAYNKFASDEHTCEIPAILLVDRKQSRIIAEARRGGKRMMLGLPLKMRELRGALMKLLSDSERREVGSY